MIAWNGRRVYERGQRRGTVAWRTASVVRSFERVELSYLVFFFAVAVVSIHPVFLSLGTWSKGKGGWFAKEGRFLVRNTFTQPTTIPSGELELLASLLFLTVNQSAVG